jgi:hypothetical protein
MRWLSPKAAKKMDKKLEESKRHEEKAKESYDRMMRSLKDLEEVLDRPKVSKAE